MSTVIVRLTGGLGNQLFQYAAARSVALQRQARLRLDTSWYLGRQDRRYLLSHFNIQEDLLSRHEMRLLHYWMDERRQTRAKSAARAVLPLLRVTRVTDPSATADPNVFPKTGRLLLDGFWQSPKYFNEIAEVIRRELRLKSPPDERNAEMIGRMSTCESVSVHLRRGDYVTDPAANRVHGTCGSEYYERAAELLCQHVGSPRFFVFSDDPEAARRELRLPGPTEFIDGNVGKCDWEDLRLMTSCRHHIIANSTFSWWGAWLAEHNEQVVVAPRAWYQAGMKPDHCLDDLIPPSWKLVEVSR